MSKLWTPQEDEILRSLRQGMGSMKELASKLPGRTPIACIVRATRTGLGARSHKQYAVRYSWIEGVVAEALKKSPNKTVFEIAEITCASYAGCYRALRKAQGSEFHISGWVRFKSTEKWTAKWSHGEGKDVPKPPRLTGAESKRRCRALAKIKAQASNPFAVAAGLSQAPKGNPGRVYIHLTDSKDDYAEAA